MTRCRSSIPTAHINDYTQRPSRRYPCPPPPAALSPPFERPRLHCGLALARPLDVSRRAHQEAMSNFRRRCGTVELWRGAGGQVVIEQSRPSDAGGNVGRPSLARARSALRALLAWLVRRQRLVLARDISLPRHCDYLPAAVVRVCVYNCLCSVRCGTC